MKCTFTLIPLLSLFAFVGQAGAQVQNAPTSSRVSAETHRHRHGPIRNFQLRPNGTGTSGNWSGYEVTGATGSVTDVRGSWIVPAVRCAPSDNTYSNFWVGIDDGNGNNGALEQIGTESDCRIGKSGKPEPVYYAWYEFLPHDKVEKKIPKFGVAPGDHISAEVSFDLATETFTVTITDAAGQTWSSLPTIVNGAQRSTAEWIAEDPVSKSGQVVPFANFGEVNFAQDYATVAGATGPIGSFASNVAITMISSGTNGTQAGTAEAIPSALSMADESSFSVDYADLTTLYSFCSAPNCTDGWYADAGLIQDDAGNLYSTTYLGGYSGCANGYGCGTVFTLDTKGHETVLYSFCPGGYPCGDGNNPVAGLIQDDAGNMYGTTDFGGLQGEAVQSGTVFKLDGTGHETVLYSFCSVGQCTDGANPQAGLIQDAAGNLYGTTAFGGVGCCGTVFKLDNTGHETVLNSFCSGGNPCLDGNSPEAGLIQDGAGNLYGTTFYGGNSGDGCGNCGGGTVFKVDGTGHETALYSFCSAPNCTDGTYPSAGLIQDAAGNLYGTTINGGNPNSDCPFGAYGCGTVFKLDDTGRETVLYSFCSAPNCTDGAYPYAGLIQDSAGNLYGTTSFGGANVGCDYGAGCGTVFKLAGVVGVGVTKTKTTTTLVSAPNPSTYGQAVTFTVVVTSSVGSPPDGETISFMKGKTVLGAGTLSGGFATFTTSTLKVGTTSVKAVYAGDSNFLGSTSKAVKQVVEK